MVCPHPDVACLSKTPTRKIGEAVHRFAKIASEIIRKPFQVLVACSVLFSMISVIRWEDSVLDVITERRTALARVRAVQPKCLHLTERPQLHAADGLRSSQQPCFSRRHRAQHQATPEHYRRRVCQSSSTLGFVLSRRARVDCVFPGRRILVLVHHNTML